MMREQILGLHNYTKGKNKDEIKEDIMELLEELKNWYIDRKNIYFDITNLEKILKYADIKKIIEDVTK